MTDNLRFFDDSLGEFFFLCVEITGIDGSLILIFFFLQRIETDDSRILIKKRKKERIVVSTL